MNELKKINVVHGIDMVGNVDGYNFEILQGFALQSLRDDPYIMVAYDLGNPWLASNCPCVRSPEHGLGVQVLMGRNHCRRLLCYDA